MHIFSFDPESVNVVHRRLHLERHHVRQLPSFLLHDSWLPVPLQGQVQAPLLQAHPLVRWHTIRR